MLRITCIAVGTTMVYDWGEWRLAAGMEEIRIFVSVTNKSGNWEGQSVYQTAVNDPTNPDSPTTIGTAVSADGNTQFMVAPTVTGKMWIRVGFGWKYTSTGGAANVAMKPSFYTTGKLIGSKNLDVYPGMLDATTPAIIPVTGWVSACKIASVMAIVKVLDNLTASSIKTRLAYRAAVDTNDPSGWELMETGYNTPGITGSSMRNTGAETFAGTGAADIDDNVVFQLGIALLLNSGTTRASIQVISAAIYG